jgi:hypothetical protein
MIPEKNEVTIKININTASFLDMVLKSNFSYRGPANTRLIPGIVDVEVKLFLRVVPATIRFRISQAIGR